METSKHDSIKAVDRANIGGLTELDQLKTECWEKAAHAFGRASIFQRRAAKLKRRLDFANFIAVLVPPLFFFIALAVGVPFYRTFAPWLISIGAVLLAVQFLWSIRSWSARWHESLAESIEAARRNEKFSRTWQELPLAAKSLDELRREFKELQHMESEFSESDVDQRITQKERRYGVRCGLFQFQHVCPACRYVPVSMQPSDCDYCGNF